jgi:thiamine-monophosphate kinase
LGDSAAGLHALQNPNAKGKDAIPLLTKRHLTPVPRFTVGRALVALKLATGAIDISDGLSSEVNHLCEQSGLGAEIHEEAIPYSDALIHYCDENHLDPLALALDGGEDYELAFTVPLARIADALRKLPAETGVPVKSIGRMTPKAKGITLITRKGERVPLKPKGFDHFKGKA